ncbi:hypothetical protein [Streptacidiphilus sp. BW17]|uniref:hypothetical protein n=1 Tax=Streptacidiphilus sp. BW17 TaxID=3156274 RepID=UPI0035173BD8
MTRGIAQQAALVLPALLTAWVVVSGAPIGPGKASLLLVLMHYGQSADGTWHRTRRQRRRRR